MTHPQLCPHWVGGAASTPKLWGLRPAHPLLAPLLVGSTCCYLCVCVRCACVCAGLGSGDQRLYPGLPVAAALWGGLGRELWVLCGVMPFPSLDCGSWKEGNVGTGTKREAHPNQCLVWKGWRGCGTRPMTWLRGCCQGSRLGNRTQRQHHSHPDCRDSVIAWGSCSGIASRGCSPAGAAQRKHLPPRLPQAQPQIPAFAPNAINPPGAALPPQHPTPSGYLIAACPLWRPGGSHQSRSHSHTSFFIYLSALCMYHSREAPWARAG